MEKVIKVSKPSGIEEFELVAAYKSGETSYIILPKVDVKEAGNDVFYVCVVNGNNLEELDREDTRWETAKADLISAVLGNNIEYQNVTDVVYNSGEKPGQTIALKEEYLNKLVENYKNNLKLEEQVVSQNSINEEQNIEPTNIINFEEALKQRDVENNDSILETQVVDNIENNIVDTPIGNVEVQQEPTIDFNNLVVDAPTGSNVIPQETVVNDNEMLLNNPVYDIQENANVVEPIVDNSTVEVNENLNNDMMFQEPVIDNFNNDVQVFPNITNEVSDETQINPQIEPLQDNVVNDIGYTNEVQTIEPDESIEKANDLLKGMIEFLSQKKIELDEREKNIIQKEKEMIQRENAVLERENSVAEAQKMIDAKLQIANTAYDNAKAVQEQMNTMSYEQQNQPTDDGVALTLAA